MAEAIGCPTDEALQELLRVAFIQPEIPLGDSGLEIAVSRPCVLTALRVGPPAVAEGLHVVGCSVAGRPQFLGSMELPARLFATTGERPRARVICSQQERQCLPQTTSDGADADDCDGAFVQWEAINAERPLELFLRQVPADHSRAPRFALTLTTGPRPLEVRYRVRPPGRKGRWKRADVHDYFTRELLWRRR